MESSISNNSAKITGSESSNDNAVPLQKQASSVDSAAKAGVPPASDASSHEAATVSSANAPLADVISFDVAGSDQEGEQGGGGCEGFGDDEKEGSLAAPENDAYCDTAIVAVNLDGEARALGEELVAAASGDERMHDEATRGPSLEQSGGRPGDITALGCAALAQNQFPVEGQSDQLEEVTFAEETAGRSAALHPAPASENQINVAYDEETRAQQGTSGQIGGEGQRSLTRDQELVARGLSALGKQWRFPSPEAPAPEVVAIAGSDLIARILHARGLQTAQQVRDFLAVHDYQPTSPLELPDVDKAVARINLAISRGERITVYGDYDVDGVTGTSLLMSVLTKLGANVDFYIPNRASEGYGLNLKAISILASKHRTKLIISCDCGVSNFAEINFAKSLGLDTLVLDHHMMPELLPPAVAIVHPKRLPESHPLFHLPGVGVAYKVCEALLVDNGRPADCPELLDFVTLGMIADMVPLIAENRYLVKIGLPILVNSPRPGLQALLAATKKSEDTDLVGFGLAPRINAVGRLSDARCAVELMITSDDQKAAELARQLHNENVRRQELCERILQEAERVVASECQLENEHAIAIYRSGWHHGVVGIVAARLVERFNRPVFIGELDEAEGIVKGSARSVPGVDLYQVLKENENLLLKWGGHKMAAGFTVEATKAGALCRALINSCTKLLAHRPLVPVLDVDVVAAPSEINLSLAKSLLDLAPFGMNNRKPIICLSSVRCASTRALGREAKHARIMVIADRTEPFECVMWNTRGCIPTDGMEIDLAFTPEVNNFNGRERLQLVLADWRLAGIAQNLDPSKGVSSNKKARESARREELHKLTNVALSQIDMDAAARIVQAQDIALNAAVNSASRVSSSKQSWKDARRHGQPLQVLMRAREKFGDDVAIFGEGCAAVPGVTFVDRTVQATKQHLLFWQFPPSAKVFAQIVRQTGSSHIYLIGGDGADCDEPSAFLRRLHGLVRFAVNQRDGQVEGEKLAAAMGASKMSVALGLAILRKVNVIDWFSEEGIIYLDLVGSPTGEAEELQEYAQLVNSLDVSKEFRMWCSSTRLEDIQLAIVPNHVDGGREPLSSRGIGVDSIVKAEYGDDEHPTEGE